MRSLLKVLYSKPGSIEMLPEDIRPQADERPLGTSSPAV
jgi:hypothetical protein